MKTLRNIIYKFTGGSNLDNKVYNELDHYSKKYEPADKFFIGAYELHLFTGIDINKVKAALASLERQGRIIAKPRYLNGIRLRTAGYACND